MADKTKNKDTADNSKRLINATEIDEFFEGIDNRIIELHQCSSDDFLSLSADFKKYHVSIKELISSGCNILEKTNKNCTPEITERLSKLEKLAKSLIQTVIKKLDSSDLFINNIFNDKDFLFVPFQNFKQNFQALKLLMANLSLEATTFHLNSRIKISNLDELYKEFELALKQVEDLKTNVSSLIRQAKDINSNIQKFNKDNWNISYTGISNIKKWMYSQNENATKHQNDIHDIDSQNIESSSTIITNLQYHDIIRQKIEHIQSAHKETIQTLFEIEKNSNSTKKDDERKASFYIKISDIAGMQAAQLIQANREYQDSISIISEQFRQISRRCNQVTLKTHNIFSATPNSDNKKNNLTRIKQTFTEISESFDNIGNAIEGYQKLSKINNQIYHQFNDINIQINKLSEQINISTTEVESLKSKFDIKSSTQIIKLIDDINNTTISIKELVGKIEYTKQKQHISKINSDIEKLHNELKYIIDLYVECKECIISTNDNVEKELNNINQLNNSLSENIKQSISNIKYYDFFTKKVNEIINDLNTVNYRIKESFNYQASNTNKQNLKDFEDRYTMDSEREVHSTLLGIQTNKSKNEEPDDDNLELF